MALWVQLVGTLAAAIIGGIVAPQVTQIKERRAARADVRQKLAEVELLRWENEPYDDFRRAIAALEAAAIIARVPRKVTRAYVRAAEQARELTETYEEGPDGNPITLLFDDEAAKNVVEKLDTLSFVLWHPWLSQLRRTRSDQFTTT